MDTTGVNLPHAVTDPIQLRVQGEDVGLAFGVDNWFRATQFICFRNEHQRPAPHQTMPLERRSFSWDVVQELHRARAYGLEPSLRDLTRGNLTGSGDDA